MSPNVFVRLVSVVCLCAGFLLHAQDVPRPHSNPNKIEAVEISGAKRTPEDTVKALVTTKAGETYDEKTVQHDVDKLWNSGRFSDVKVTKETGNRGGIVVRFTVTERPN